MKWLQLSFLTWSKFRMKKKSLSRLFDKSGSSFSSRKLWLRRSDRENDAIGLEKENACVDQHRREKIIRVGKEEICKLCTANDVMCKEIGTIRLDSEARTVCIQNTANFSTEAWEIELQFMANAKASRPEGEPMCFPVFPCKRSPERTREQIHLIGLLSDDKRRKNRSRDDQNFWHWGNISK